MANLFKDITWRIFETRCVDYINKRFENENVTIHTNIGNSHSSFDAEIIFHNKEFANRILCEFKHHSRNLGVEVLGKYVMLLDISGTNRLIVLSASDISIPSKAQLSSFAEKHNLIVEYQVGSNLLNEFRKYDVVSEDYIADEEIKQTINIRVLISETPYPQDNIEPQNKGIIYLRRNPFFFLHFYVENNSSDDDFSFFELSTPKLINQRLMGLAKNGISMRTIKSPLKNIIKPNESSIITIVCAYEKRIKSSISIGKIALGEKINASTSETIYVDIPIVYLPKYITTPLCGKIHKNSLYNIINEKLPYIEKKGSVLFFNGKSGTGKSRLLYELYEKAILKGFLCEKQDGEINCSHLFFQRIIYNAVLGVSPSQKIDDNTIYQSLKNDLPSQYSESYKNIFLDEKNTYSEDFYKSVRFFVDRCSKDSPILLIIDNIQELSLKASMIIDSILECLIETDYKFLLALSLNEDRIDFANNICISIINQLNNPSLNYEEIIHKIDVKAFDDDDITEFMEKSLSVKFNKEVISKIRSKIGNRIYDLEQFVNYLEERGITTKAKDGYWDLCSSLQLELCLDDFSGNLTEVMQQRISMLFENRDSILLNEVLCTFIILWENIPSQLIQDLMININAINTLEDRNIIKYDSSYSSYSFNHTILRDFISSKKEIYNDVFNISKRIYEVINDSKSRYFPDWKLKRIAFDCLKYFGNSNEIISSGMEVVKLMETNSLKLESLRILKYLFNYIKDNQINAEYINEYITIGTKYIATVYEYKNTDEGIDALDYLKAHTLLHQNKIKVEIMSSFFHVQTNILLHSGADIKALEILKHYERYLNSHNNNEGFCTLFNRKSVAYMHLGKDELAMEACEKAIKYAEMINIPYWLSVIKSDIAFVKINMNLTGESVLEDIIKNFNEAINTPNQNNNEGRERELLQQKCLIAFLGNNFEYAYELAQVGYDLSRKSGHFYLLNRFINLKALFYIIKKEYEKANSCLRESIEMLSKNKKLNNNWKTLNNLAVVSLLSNKNQFAEKCLFDAIQKRWSNNNSMGNSRFDVFLLKNCLIVNKELVEPFFNQLSEYNQNVLNDYANVLAENYHVQEVDILYPKDAIETDAKKPMYHYIFA